MSNENPYSSPDSDPVASVINKNITDYRKQIIPKWIKVFGWLFIVFGSLVPIIGIYSAINGVSSQYSLYGLETSGTVFSPLAMSIMSLFIAHGICAYGLLFGKSWGISSCMGLGYVSTVICIYTMLTGNQLFIRLELALLIPYLIKLHQLKPLWIEKRNS